MKIIVADDHALFREGLRHILGQLAPDVGVLEAASYEAAAQLLRAHADADLALVDLHMPGEAGGAAFDQLLASASTIPVVVLSASDDRRRMQHALDAGAMGFVPKSETAQVMLGALRLVLAGGVYVPPALIRDPVQRQQSAGTGGLTPRQRQVLELLIQGKPNKEIGRALGLSESTVKVHITAILKILKAVNRTQASQAAIALGLLTNTP